MSALADPRSLVGMTRNTTNSASAAVRSGRSKPKLRDLGSSAIMATAINTLATSKACQRSRSDISTNRYFMPKSGHAKLATSPVRGPVNINMTGNAKTAEAIAALVVARKIVVPETRFAAKSLAKHNRPSTPQAALWVTQATTPINANTTDLARNRPVRRRYSHKASALKTSDTPRVKLKNPKLNGLPKRNGKANSNVGEKRPWASCDSQINPIAPSTGIRIAMSLTAGSSPTSDDIGMTSRSAPRLPISCQSKS